MKISTVKLQNWQLVLGFAVASFLLAPHHLNGEQIPADKAEKLERAHSARKAGIRAFRVSNPYVRIKMDTALGIPAEIEGDLSRGLTKAEPVEAAYDFFETNKTMYGLNQPRTELKVKRVEKDEYGVMIEFIQAYNGVEVIHRGIRAHFSKAGTLKLVKGNLHPDIDISSIPSVVASTAVEKAKHDLSPRSKNARIISTDQRVFLHQSIYYLIWLVKIHVDSPLGAWEYFIDASSGQILHKADRIMRLNAKDNLSRKTLAQVIQTAPSPIDTTEPVYPDSLPAVTKPSTDAPKEFRSIPMESIGVAEPKKPVFHDSNVIVVPPPGSSPETLNIQPKMRPPGRKLPVDDSIPSVIPIPSVPSAKPISPEQTRRAVPTKKKKKTEPDSLQIKSVPQSNTSQVLPDLAPYLPSGWSDRIVVSDVRSTNTHSPVVVGEMAFIDWAGENRGSTVGVRFTSVLRIDGVIVEYFDTDPPLDNTEYFFFEDFAWTFTPDGLHTIQIEYDYYNQVAESNETNNTYAIAVTVQPRPVVLHLRSAQV